MKVCTIRYLVLFLQDIVYGIFALISHFIAGCFEAHFAGKLLNGDCRTFLQGPYESCAEFGLLAAAAVSCE